MFSTWVQNHSPNKSGTDSQTFFVIFRDFLVFLRLFPDFLGDFPEFLGDFPDFVRRK